MDEVEGIIREALPHLSSGILGKVKGKLLSIGVEDAGDLKLVNEEDLLDVLKPIQIRKFIQHCKTRYKDIPRAVPGVFSMARTVRFIPVKTQGALLT